MYFLFCFVFFVFFKKKKKRKFQCVYLRMFECRGCRYSYPECNVSDDNAVLEKKFSLLIPFLLLCSPYHLSVRGNSSAAAGA